MTNGYSGESLVPVGAFIARSYRDQIDAKPDVWHLCSLVRFLLGFGRVVIQAVDTQRILLRFSDTGPSRPVPNMPVEYAQPLRRRGGAAFENAAAPSGVRTSEATWPR